MRHASISREAQTAEVLTILREAREMGYSRIEVKVTRGGTVKAVAHAGEGGVKTKHDWKP